LGENVGKSSALLLVILLLAASCYIARLHASVESKTIVVPDDYATIGAAVERAAPGDTIYVKRGRHAILGNETLVINKTLSIIGEDVATTFLIGPGSAYGSFPMGMKGDKPEYTLLSGETIPTNFLIPPKVAIQVNADNFKISQVTIDNCDVGIIVSGNGTEVSHTKMPSASVTGSHSVISDNIIASLSVKGHYQNVTRNFGSINIDGSFSIVAENTAHSDMHLTGSSNILIRNSFSTIYLEYAHSNIICNNSLSCLWIGFYGHTCSNNTVCKNRLIGPGIWGILMGAGSYNVFHDNLISNYRGDYSGYGIAIGGNHLVAEHNTFYRNILINNNRHVSTNWEVLGAGNYWDNGKEGNYWDDYKGTDSNGDGIGDVPYIVKGVKWDDTVNGPVSFVFGQDNYPLMSPFDIDTIPIELPEWAPPSLNPTPEPNPSPSPNPAPEPNPTPQSQLSEPFPITWALAAAGLVAVVVACIALKFDKIRKKQ
jgi:hypothetical protein